MLEKFPPQTGAEAVIRRRMADRVFEDYAASAGGPDVGEEEVWYAPYGGGNVAQYFNGTSKIEEAHFMLVDVIARFLDKDRQPRRELAVAIIQIAEVPLGKQGMLYYGPSYFKDRSYLLSSKQGSSEGHPVVKPEPVEDDDTRMDDVPMQGAITPSALALHHKRPASGDRAQEPKRHQTSSTLSASGPSDAAVSPVSLRRSTRASATALMARLQRQRSPVGLGDNPPMPDASRIMRPEDGATASHLQSLTIEETGDDDSSSLSSAPDYALEDSDFEDFGMEEPAGSHA